MTFGMVWVNPDSEARTDSRTDSHGYVGGVKRGNERPKSCFHTAPHHATDQTYDTDIDMELIYCNHTTDQDPMSCSDAGQDDDNESNYPRNRDRTLQSCSFPSLKQS